MADPKGAKTKKGAASDLSTFEFGGSVKTGALVMQGVCRKGGPDPDAMVPCEWTVSKEKSGAKAQGQRIKIFF